MSYEHNMKHNSHYIGKNVQFNYKYKTKGESSMRWIVKGFHPISGNIIAKCIHDISGPRSDGMDVFLDIDVLEIVSSE